MFPLKNLARKGLRYFSNWGSSVYHVWWLPSSTRITLWTNSSLDALWFNFSRCLLCYLQCYIHHINLFCFLGGRLFLIAFFMTKDGQHLGFTEGGRNKFETLRTIWNQLYEEGKITKVNNTLEPRRNGPHFADDIFKRIFSTGDVRIWVKFSLMLVVKGSIDN